MSADQDPQADEPKIVVDSDWKEQVAKEKEAEQAAAAETGAAAEPTSGNETSGEPAAAAEPAGTEPPAAERATGQGAATSADRAAQPPLPPASFEVLVSMLFSQAMAMLGQIPDPSTGKTQVNKGVAKHTIDTLEVLKEKTEGNLTEDESKVLDEALHALRMAFVSAPG